MGGQPVTPGWEWRTLLVMAANGVLICGACALGRLWQRRGWPSPRQLLHGRSPVLRMGVLASYLTLMWMHMTMAGILAMACVLAASVPLAIYCYQEKQP